MRNKLWILFLCLFATATSGQQSFTLSEAVNYAIKNSDQLKLDEINIKKAEAQVTEFKAIGMPKVTAGIDYQYYFYVPATPIEDFISPSVYRILEGENLVSSSPTSYTSFKFAFLQPHNLTGKVNAEALIFDGSYLVGLRAAKMFKDLQKKSISVNEQAIKSNVTKAYLNTLIIKINEETLQNNISNIEKALSDTKEIYKSGFAEQLDVDRLELSYENLKTEFEKLEQVKSLSLNLLKFQMNYPLEEQISLTEDLETLINLLKVEEVNLEAPIDYNKKAEIDQIETGKALQALDVERIEKSKLPSVFAFINASGQLQRTNLFSSTETGFLPSVGAGVGISMPIYDGGERKGKMQQAQLKLQETDIQLEQFKKGVSIQILNARLNYVNAQKTLDNRERALKIVEGIYEKTQIKFTEGVGSSIEVSQAESSLYSAQSNHVNALYDLLNAKIELDIASGNL